MAEASAGPQNPSSQYLAAAALFVLELTRADPQWAEWKETDVTAVRSVATEPFRLNQSGRVVANVSLIGTLRSRAIPRLKTCTSKAFQELQLQLARLLFQILEGGAFQGSSFRCLHDECHPSSFQ